MTLILFCFAQIIWNILKNFQDLSFLHNVLILCERNNIFDLFLANYNRNKIPNFFTDKFMEQNFSLGDGYGSCTIRFVISENYKENHNFKNKITDLSMRVVDRYIDYLFDNIFFF